VWVAKEGGKTEAVLTLYLSFMFFGYIGEKTGMKLFLTSSVEACFVDEFSRSVHRTHRRRTVSEVSPYGEEPAFTRLALNVHRRK
jgi:hypothetical protein